LLGGYRNGTTIFCKAGMIYVKSQDSRLSVKTSMSET
jgi:hypothetical protein